MSSAAVFSRSEVKRPDKEDKIIGSRIRACRKHAGIETESLARLTGISPSVLELYENGKTEIPAVELYLIAGALGADFDALVNAAAASGSPEPGRRGKRKKDDLF